MTTLLEIDLDVAKSVYAAGNVAIRHMKDIEGRMIDEAVKGKFALPEHYWQERWKMEQKHRALGSLIQALEERT